MKNDNFLSALLFIIATPVEGELEEKEKRRMLVLSMLSIDKFPYQMKLKLRNALILKCK